MSQAHIVIENSIEGRQGRATNSSTFLVKPTGAYIRANAVALLQDMSKAISQVQLENVYYVNGIYQPLNADGSVTANASFSEPLTEQGKMEVTGTDVAAPLHVCLALKKRAESGIPGINYIRHVLTAEEYTTYLEDGTIPARFTVSPVGGYNAGHTVQSSILKACTDNDYDLMLPSKTILTVLTERPVTDIAFAGFKLNDPSRPKLSAAVNLAHAVKQQVREIARKIKKLVGTNTLLTLTTALLAKVEELRDIAVAAVATLAAIDAAAFSWPTIFATLFGF